MAVRCAAITRGGSRCPSAVVAGSEFCWTHDPQLEGARRQASAKGGKARSNKARAAAALPPVMSDAEVLAWLSLILTRLIDGEIEPSIATAASSLAKAMVSVRQASELAQRVAELERDAGITTGSRWSA